VHLKKSEACSSLQADDQNEDSLTQLPAQLQGILTLMTWCEVQCVANVRFALYNVLGVVSW
jgi:hypothetical protein